MENETKVSRNDLLIVLYQTTSKQELLRQFGEKIQTSKKKKEDKYIHLLENIIHFSHAIIYDHSIQTAHNYRQSFMTKAKECAGLKLDDKDIEKAFSFLNRTEKKSINEAIKPTSKGKVTTIKDECKARASISDLKKQLDNDSYTTTRGQKREDKEIYIKVALVTLSIGESLKNIMGNNLVVDSKTLIIDLDYKVVKAYIKDIKEHYKGKEGTDYPRAIRKAISQMDIWNSKNANGLIALYKECIS